MNEETFIYQQILARHIGETVAAAMKSAGGDPDKMKALAEILEGNAERVRSRTSLPEDKETGK